MSTSIWLHFAVVLRQNSVSCLVFAWGDRGCFGQSCPQVHSQTLDIIVVTRLSCPYLLHLHPVETLVHSTRSGLKNLEDPEISTRNPKIPHRLTSALIQLKNSSQVSCRFFSFLIGRFHSFFDQDGHTSVSFWSTDVAMLYNIYKCIYYIYIFMYLFVYVNIWKALWGTIHSSLSSMLGRAC